MPSETNHPQAEAAAIEIDRYVRSLLKAAGIKADPPQHIIDETIQGFAGIITRHYADLAANHAKAMEFIDEALDAEPDDDFDLDGDEALKAVRAILTTGLPDMKTKETT